MSELPDSRADASARSSDGALTRSLLSRRVRPGAVDVAHLRILAAPRFSLISDSPLLKRLLARRGVDDTLVATGTLVLLSQATAEVSVDTQTARAGEPGTMARPSFAKGDVGRSRPVAESNLSLARGVVLPGRASSDQAPSSAHFVDTSTAAVRAPVVAVGKIVLADRSSEPAHVPLLRSSAAVAAFARDLPGPAIGSDLSLPPNPVSPESPRGTMRRLRQALPVEVGSEPVELGWLPLAQSAPKTSESIAMSADPVQQPELGRAMAAVPGYRSPILALAPVPGSSGSLPASAAAPGQLAESVGRELVRSMRRARERRGIAPWKS